MENKILSINVLIVDDDEEDYILTKEILSESINLSCNVVWANNYESGLKLIEEIKPNVIFVDYRLGAKSGLDFIKESKEKYFELPFILLTGHGGYEVDFEAMQVGASDFISKNKMDSELIERSIRYSIFKSKTENELKTLNASKDKFFSIIAHDLKSPFTALLGYLEFLKVGFDDYSLEEIKNDVDRVHQVSKNVYELLNNLLEWARIQTGSLETNLEKLNLFEEVKTAIILLKGNAKIKEIEIINDVFNDCNILADEYMLSTILRNLISNAIKFTTDNGKITISSKIINDYVLLSVKDTGVGISEIDLPKLFRIDITHSTLGTGKEKGTGLGLILCKELVEKMNGQIEVNSTIGIGSEFIIKLQLTK